MTTPTDWFFQTAETEAAWTEADLGEDGWAAYQQLMGDAGRSTGTASGGSSGAAPPPASGTTASPSAPAAAAAPAREAEVPTPPGTNQAAPPGDANDPTPPAPAPPDDAAESMAPADPAAPPAIIWPGMAYLSGALVGQFVTEMLAVGPPGLTKNRVNTWVRAHGCSHNEGVIRKGLVNWLRAAGVVAMPNAGVALRFTETDPAIIAQRLLQRPYHPDMERSV